MSATIRALPAVLVACIAAATACTTPPAPSTFGALCTASDECGPLMCRPDPAEGLRRCLPPRLPNEAGESCALPLASRPRGGDVVVDEQVFFGAAVDNGDIVCGAGGQPDVVIGFLRFQDWGLMLVMGGAAGMAVVAYKGFPRWFAHPLLGGQFLTQPAQWNRQTVIGSAIFGIGWGLSGVCPGPAIAALGTGNTDILWALGGIVLGGLAHGLTAQD